MADYPNDIFTQRAINNVTGVVYDPSKATRLYAEDVTKLGDEVTAIETVLGENPNGAYDTVKLWLAALASAVAGIVTTFLGLSDTPSSYSGAGGKTVKVNSGATALEFVDVVTPVKATGSEIDTGTDDAKFVTPKAINDSHNVPDVAPGSSGNVLTSNGTDWTSVAPAGGSDFVLVKITLTAAQVRGMFATPITIVAGVAGKVPVIVRVVMRFTYGGTQSSGGGTVRIIEESGGAVWVNGFSNTLMNGTANLLANFSPNVDNCISGKGMMLTNAGGAFTGSGNSTLDVYVSYYMVTL